MEKRLSTQIDESIIHQIGILANEMNTTREAIIEAAIELYSKQIRIKKEQDIFAKTSGAWQRLESTEETINNARSTFNKSMEKHH